MEIDAPSVRSPTGRIKAFDWLRGAAVLAMIQTHALTLLRHELRSGTWYQRIDFVDGLVAPAFIFAAGFSLALVQLRGAAGGAQTSRIGKTLRRIAEVLIVATLLNWMWFPIFQEPKWFFRVDILHCIGLSLLTALPLLLALAKSPRLLRWTSLLLALAAFAAAPLGERVRGPLAAFLNISSGSMFPLLPWAGYVYLGASAGAVAGSSDAEKLPRWLLGLSALGLGVWTAQPLFGAIYPAQHLWINEPATHGQRWAIVCVLSIALLLAERRWGAQRPGLAVRFAEVFGTSSLAAYFFHQALMYYEVWGFSFYRVWGNRSGWAEYWLLTAALIGCTFVLAAAADWLYRRVGSLRPGVRSGVVDVIRRQVVPKPNR